MTPHEELRALLGKLPNPERAMELLEQVEAVPVVGEPDMAWNADDPEEGGYSPDEFADYVAPSLGEESVFTVALAVSQPDRKMRVWREEDADGNHEVRWEWLDTPTNPTDSIPRARLDELLAAEKNVSSLRASLSTLLEFVDDIPGANCSCHISPPCNDCVEYGGLRLAIEDAKEALSASKADGCGASELDLIGGES